MALKVMYSQISWNLDMIGGLNLDETFYVVDTKLFVENRTFASFLWRCADTRKSILIALQTTLNMLDELVTSYYNSNFFQLPFFHGKNSSQTLEEIQTQLCEIYSKQDKVTSGFQRLATFKRYQLDHSFQLSINRIIVDFSKNCNRAKILHSKHVDEIPRQYDVSKNAKMSDFKVHSPGSKNDQPSLEEVSGDE